MDKIKELIVKYKELITYVIFGGLTTLVNWGTYSLLVKFTTLGAGDNTALKGVTISNAIAWAAGVIFAYITNKLWVFESKSFAAKTLLFEFFSFVAARGITGVLEIFGVPFLIKIGLDQTVFGIKGAISKVTVSVAVVILNYVFSKLVVFRKKKNKEEA